MAKVNFIFDKDSGTMKPAVEPAHNAKSTPVSVTSPELKPVADEVKVDLTTKTPNVDLNEDIVQFRKQSDYTVFQVTEERSGKPMMYIGGYALEIKFNMVELRSTERIEQLLGGLQTMFRSIIMEQALSK